MNIEKDIFKRGKIDFRKLLDYGFVRNENNYIYQKEFMKNFLACVTVDLNECVKGKVYDLKTGDEYTNFRIEDLIGFASIVRDKYITFLKDIANYVLLPECFLLEQSNRIANLILEKYQVQPEFLWEKDPHFGVFRNIYNQKWFGIIMNVDKSKIMPNLSGEIEILNLKLDDKVGESLKRRGIYPAYHMNKKSWVSIVLDDSLSDEEIMAYVQVSYSLVSQVQAWIIPANPLVYDIIREFKHTDVIRWHQNVHVKVGDYVYIYLTKPYQAILFECLVIEADIVDMNSCTGKSMKLQLKKCYDKNDFKMDKLKKYGLKSVRSARRISYELYLVLHS